MLQTKQNAMLFLFKVTTCLTHRILRKAPRKGFPSRPITRSQMPNQKLALFRVAIKDLVTQVPNIQILHSARAVPGTKIRSARRTMISEGRLLGGASCFLRIFGHCVFLYRALLGHCAKQLFLQVATASTLGELKNLMF